MKKENKWRKVRYKWEATRDSVSRCFHTTFAPTEKSPLRVIYEKVNTLYFVLRLSWHYGLGDD